MTEPNRQTALGFALRDAYPWPDLAALASVGEQLGFEALFLPEVGARDTLAALAALAGVTDRLRLGTGVVPLPSRPPELLAMAAATVHECSGGRLLLGLGTGPSTRGPHGARATVAAGDLDRGTGSARDADGRGDRGWRAAELVHPRARRARRRADHGRRRRGGARSSRRDDRGVHPRAARRGERGGGASRRRRLRRVPGLPPSVRGDGPRPRRSRRDRPRCDAARRCRGRRSVDGISSRGRRPAYRL